MLLFIVINSYLSVHTHVCVFVCVFVCVRVCVFTPHTLIGTFHSSVHECNSVGNILSEHCNLIQLHYDAKP